MNSVVQLFQRYHYERPGEVSKATFRHVLEMLGQSATDSQWEDIVRQAEGSDGYIDLNRFFGVAAADEQSRNTLSFEQRLSVLEQKVNALQSSNQIRDAVVTVVETPAQVDSQAHHDDTAQLEKLFYPQGKDQPPICTIPSSYEAAMEDLGCGVRGASLFEETFQDEWIKISDALASRLHVDPIIQRLLPHEWSARLANSVKLNFQPYVNTLDDLMDKAARIQPEFKAMVEGIAESTQGAPLVPELKGTTRCRSKASFKYADGNGIAWYRLTDINRATLLYDTLDDMYTAVETIKSGSERWKVELLEFNDRYRQPISGGYRDLQLLIRFKGVVCEMQLNTHIMAAVKESSGHRSFEVSRELKGAIEACNLSKVVDILTWGEQTLSENSNETLEKIINDPSAGLIQKAAAAGQAEIVSTFLRFRADPDMRNTTNSWTALHAAMASGHERVVWALLSQGNAQFGITDADANPPLLLGLLMLRSRPNDERAQRVVSVLAQWAGAEHMRQMQARLPAELEKRYQNSSALVNYCFDGNVPEMLSQLNHFAHPNSVDKEGTSAILAAVKSGNHAAVDLLLRAGADPQTKDDAGYEVWRIALKTDVEMVQSFVKASGDDDLIRFGCTPAECKILGWSPFNFLVSGRALSDCIDAGFTLQECSLNGFTPMHFKIADCTARHCREVGWTSTQCKNGGFSQQQCEEAGFSSDELKGIYPPGSEHRAVSVHYAATIFLEEVHLAGLDQSSNIYDISKLVIHPRGRSLICPRDGKLGRAYVDCVEGVDNVGAPDFYLSYIWRYSVGSVISSLASYCSRKALDCKKTNIWWDICNINHHREWFGSGFQAWLCRFLRRAAGLTVLAAIIDVKDMQYAKRSWSLFEFGTANMQGTTVEIIFVPDELTQVTSFDLDEVCSKIKIEESQSSMAQDKVNILNAVASFSGGQAAFNSSAQKRVHEALTSMVNQSAS